MPVTKLWSSGLEASAFTDWAILLAPQYLDFCDFFISLGIIPSSFILAKIGFYSFCSRLIFCCSHVQHFIYHLFINRSLGWFHIFSQTKVLFLRTRQVLYYCVVSSARYIRSSFPLDTHSIVACLDLTTAVFLVFWTPATVLPTMAVLMTSPRQCWGASLSLYHLMFYL